MGKFSSAESTFCADSSFGVRSTPVLPQWHVKDPSHSAKSAGGRLHLNTHTPLTQQSWSELTMPLSIHSVGTYPETSSHATCLGTFSHSCLCLLNHCGLILHEEWNKFARANFHFKKKKKKRRLGMNGRTFSKNPFKRGKHHHHRKPNGPHINQTTTPLGTTCG